MRKVGIVGLGVVGGSLAESLTDVGVPVRVYDRDLGVGKAEDLSGCSVVFICVPTPVDENGAYYLTEVWSAVREVESHLDPGSVVAIKSTVPPGTCDVLAGGFPQMEFASLPEFLVGARPMETLTRSDRIVIGARATEAAAVLADLMTRIAPAAPVILLRPTEAELVKLCSNAMLAAKVSLANELSEMCRLFDVAWGRVQSAVGLDRRIGPDHLTVTSERGFGGSCLPKDLDGLIAAARAVGYTPAVLKEIAEFNRRIHLEREREKVSDMREEVHVGPEARRGQNVDAVGLTKEEQHHIEQHLSALGYID